MAQKTTELTNGIVRVCRVLFGFVAVYAAAIIASDAWNLITPDVALQRWTMATVMLAATGAVWYLARAGAKRPAFYAALVNGLVLVYIGIASYSVYYSRGMASRSVMLFTIPIIIAAVLASRVALFAAAIMSTAAYVMTVMLYFANNPGEGYKAELYTEVGFYVALFFVIAALLQAVISRKK